MHLDPTPPLPPPLEGANWPRSLHSWALALKPCLPLGIDTHTLPGTKAIGFGRGEEMGFERGGDAVWERRR